jgi:hypothetical protein
MRADQGGTRLPQSVYPFVSSGCCGRIVPVEAASPMRMLHRDRMVEEISDEGQALAR